MCVIDGPIKRVAATKLFGCPTADKTRQLTVYSNAVDTPEENVMLLPVPHPESVVLETVHKELFEECKASFTYARGKSPLSVDRESMSQSGSYLAIRDHGSYQVVLVPSMAELDSVPPSFTTLSDDVKTYIRKHYGNGRFGVILCKLKAGATEYEPFAYSHALLETGKLFLPTRHYHVHDKPVSRGDEDYFERSYAFMAGGGGDRFAAFASTVGVAPIPTNPDDQADDWDHDVYTAGTVEAVAHKNRVLFPSDTNHITWSRMPAAYQLGTDVPLRCFSRRGYGPNEDLTFPLDITSQ
jgi:hypothetical protein